MIKVLQIMDGKSYGGITKLMVDIEKNISKDIKFDYLTANNIDKKFNNLDTDRSTLKGRIKFNHRLHKFLKKNKYDIVHINSGAFFYVFCCVIICRISGVKKIITHSHNSPNINIVKRILIKILNPLFRKMTSIKLSCSDKASKSLYTKTKNVIIIKNGIDIDKYKYNEKIRNEYRKKLNVENKCVYGHIGRFEEQKNHDFLLNVFYKIQKVNKNSVLILIGEGSLKQLIEEKAASFGIKDKVLFLGFRKDADKILNAMDVFLFPSIYEGLGIVLIEAQTNGLPVVVSNNVPSEAKISDEYIKIKDFDIDNWVNKVINIQECERNNAYLNTIKSNYDIKQTTKQLEQIYRDLMKNIKKGSVKYLIIYTLSIIIAGIILYPLLDILYCKFITNSEFSYSITDHIISPIIIGAIIGIWLWYYDKHFKK